MSRDNTEILEVKMREFENLRSHDVFNEVIDEGQK